LVAWPSAPSAFDVGVKRSFSIVTTSGDHWWWNRGASTASCTFILKSDVEQHLSTVV
jgi:hypothetical protein